MIRSPLWRGLLGIIVFGWCALAIAASDSSRVLYPPAATTVTKVVPDSTDASVPLYRPASTVPPPAAVDTMSDTSDYPEGGEVRGGARTSNDYIAGRMDGERDARGNGLWFIAGLPGVCCYGIGLGGILAAYLLPPSPPTAALLGQSAEYIMGYTEGYQNSAKTKNAKQAAAGCMLGSLLELGLYLLAVTTM